jgi:hypothetical protein
MPETEFRIYEDSRSFKDDDDDDQNDQGLSLKSSFTSMWSGIHESLLDAKVLIRRARILLQGVFPRLRMLYGRGMCRG